MKKLLAILLALAMVFCFAACGGSSDSGDGGGTDAEPAEVLNVTLYSANTGNTAAEAIVEMAELMNERSDGAVNANAIEAGTIGYQDEAIQMMYSNDLQIVVDTIDLVNNDLPGSCTWSSLTYLFNTDEEAEEAWDNRGWLFQACAEYSAEGADRHIFNYIYNGFKNISLNKPVTSFEDWQGLKCRVGTTPWYHTLLQAYGFQTVSNIEPYTSLQNGTVDGIYFSEEGDQTFKLEEIIGQLVQTHDTYGSNLYSCTETWWSTLTPEQQEFIDGIVVECATKYNEISKASVAEYVESLPGLGVEVLQPDENMKNSLKKAAVFMWEDFFADENVPDSIKDPCRECFEKNYEGIA